MDYWCAERFGVPYDRDGAIAQRGAVDETMLGAMLADPYFLQPAPKSTGRERFNPAWLKPFLRPGLRDDAVLATLTELTARSVADEVKTYTPERVLLCGGGAHNVFLRGRIAALLGDTEVVRTDEYGIPSEWMEAMAFAWLAFMRINEQPVGLAPVTGASGNTILGGIYA